MNNLKQRKEELEKELKLEFGFINKGYGSREARERNIELLKAELNGINLGLEALSRKNKEIFRLLRIKCNVRMRGLECDIRTQKNKDYFTGALNEYNELYRHLEKIDWIIADIECGSKYLDEKEKKEFIKLKQQLTTEGEGK